MTLPAFPPPATRSGKEWKGRRSVRECQSAEATPCPHARLAASRGGGRLQL